MEVAGGPQFGDNLIAMIANGFHVSSDFFHSYVHSSTLYTVANLQDIVKFP